MTTTVLALPNLVPWGPLSDCRIGAQGNQVDLNDANDRQAGWWRVPKTGVVTHVGVRVNRVYGTPPSHNIGLVTVDADGDPTETPYGGSANTTGTFGTATSTITWWWFQLATPANAVKGELCAVMVWPGATPPDGSNYIRVMFPGWTGKADQQPCTGYSANAGVAWTESVPPGIPSFAMKYSDGDIYPYAYLNSDMRAIRTSYTPNEIGAKFTVPFDCKLAGLIVDWRQSAVAVNAIVDLYNAASVSLKQVTLYGAEMLLGPKRVIFDADIPLTKDLVYRVAAKSSVNTDQLQVYEMNQADAGARYSFPDGQRWCATSRKDTGDWTDLLTAVPAVALLLSEISYDSGSTPTPAVVQKKHGVVPVCGVIRG